MILIVKVIIVVLVVVMMIRTHGVEREVLMMSNMRMIKMIILMAMMMPSKALGL